MEARIRAAESGAGVRLYGPARIRVDRGRLLILGIELGEGASISVPPGRSYYLLAMGGSEISIELGEGASIEHPRPGEEPLESWVETADRIVEECDGCTVAVLGPVDAGKTSVAALIANRSFQAGLRPYIIDADVGQADIGPPAFVSGSMPEAPVLWLRELEPDRMVFAGHVEPGPVQAQIVGAIHRLTQRAREKRSNITVIDTDGWVEGWHALEFKMNLLRAARPSTVLVVGDELLYRFIRDRWPRRVIHLRSPSVAARRDRSTRIALRSENYKRFLEGAPIRELSLRTTPIVNSCVPLASVRPPRGKPAIYEYPGGVCSLFDSEEPPGPDAVKSIVSRGREALIIYTGGFRGVLVGLTDPEGWDHPGVVESIDLEKGTIRVRTRYLGPVEMLVAGRIRLAEGYTDTGARRIWV